MSFTVIAAQLSAPATDPSWSTVLSTVAAAVAVVAALVTLVYARKTVVDGRAAHRELMQAQRKANDDFITAHSESA